MNKEYNFKIGNREIGPGNPVFIIVEMSANHNQDFERAKEIIKSAAESGADAIKLQTYTPNTLTINCSEESFIVRGSNPDWEGLTLYDLYTKAYMPWEWQPKLQKIAEDCGIILFSTPYDETAVNFLEKMDVPVYKIASFELVDIEFLKKVAETKKPVIISKGMATIEEIELALSTLRNNGAKDIALLHCVSSYPAKPEDMNLITISDLEEKFRTVPGLSDHSLGITMAIESVAFGACVVEKHFTLKRSDGGPDSSFSIEPEELKQLVKSDLEEKFRTVPGLSDHSLGITMSIESVAFGACVIEKHFTLKRSDGGPDSSFSIEPKELKQLVESVREAEKAIGKIQYGIIESELANIAGRRSLFVVRDIKAGQEFTTENIRSIRPGYGLAPKFLPEILGKKAAKDIERGTPLNRGLVAKS